MTTRRGFLWLCGASTAGIYLSGPRVFICDECTADAGGLLAASGWRTTGVMSAAKMKELAEQTRQALLAMSPAEEQELRKRYGIGENVMLEDVGQDCFKVTRKRIRQIEAKELRKRFGVG